MPWQDLSFLPQQCWEEEEVAEEEEVEAEDKEVEAEEKEVCSRLCIIPCSSGGKEEWIGACGMLVGTRGHLMHHGTTNHNNSQYLVNFNYFYDFA